MTYEHMTHEKINMTYGSGDTSSVGRSRKSPSGKLALVCVCVCVRARARVCVCVCVRACQSDVSVVRWFV
jgi:hypothetical protein